VKPQGRARAGKEKGKISSRGSEGPKLAFSWRKEKAECDSTAGKLFLPPAVSRIKPWRNLLVAKISPEKAWEMGERESICIAGRG